jgi:hypothetical protein
MSPISVPEIVESPIVMQIPGGRHQQWISRCNVHCGLLVLIQGPAGVSIGRSGPAY